MVNNSGTRPNILLLICHDLGRHLGCYGVPGLETPNLDELARQGVRFTNYFCTAPQCSPSRGSIITGLLPHNNGLMGLAHLGWELNDDVVTLPQRLAGCGYETYLFGPQHEAGEDNAGRLGYQHIGRRGPAWEVADQVVNFLRERAATVEFGTNVPPEAISNRSSEQPFYASVGFFEPHRPYDLPQYTPDDPERVTVMPYLPDVPGVRQEVAQLQGMIRAVDKAVGKILTALDETGLRDNTLVVFTTDHGIALPRAKGTLYDPGIGTALLMHWPGQIEGGRVYDQLLSNVDLMPTLMELVGNLVSEDIDGRSFLPLLRGEEIEEREYIFAEMTWHDQYDPVRGIRTHRYKYIRSFGARPLVYIPADIYDSPSGKAVRDEYYGKRRPAEELYDLEKDPEERNNLINDPQYQDIAAALRKRVQQWMEQTNDPLLSGPVAGRNELEAARKRKVNNASPFEF